MITIEARKFSDLLDAHLLVKGEGVEVLTRRYARLCAVELANRTQPWSVGGGAAGKAAGAQAVDGNIRKVIKDKQGMRDLFDKTKIEGLGKAMIRLLNAGRYDILAKIMASCGLVTSADRLIMVSPGDMNSEHQGHRSRSTGRTFIKKGEVVFSPSGFGGYIKEVQKRVGLCKSGWADCARQIGGTSGDNARGIPAWAKQSSRNGKIQDRSKDPSNPHFVMTNTTPWVSRLLKEEQQTIALTVAKNKMIKALEMSFFAAKRGQRAAREAINKNQEAA